jgi:nucleoside-diphosphate-sugar epimerase
MGMSEERFFVTGALGCIGAWVVRNLVREGISVTVFDLASNPHRMKLIMSEDELKRVNFVIGDITDFAAIEKGVKDNNITHIIHLAALQVPFCKADPVLGAKVNVVGTVNIFEAAKRIGLRHVVYASSAAVYGRDEDDNESSVPADAPLTPRTHYGVYKQANEGTARIYWQDDGVGSIGLRPYTVYGPGRDQGMTSSPTKAMLAAAIGQSYHIPFGGRGDFQYTDDTAKAFIYSARANYQGAGVFNLRGSVVHMKDILDAIHQVEPNAQITFEDKPLPLPESLDDTTLVSAIGKLPQTPLSDGIAATIALFKQAVADGRLPAEVK